MPFKHLIKTRYAETAQDGIIHHSSYVIYLEVARLEFFKSLGCDINALEKEKLFCPVIELSLKYLKPLYSLEEIVVSITVGELLRVRFCLEYEIRQNEQIRAKGSIAHCFINESFKPVPIPKSIFTKMKEEKEALLPMCE